MPFYIEIAIYCFIRLVSLYCSPDEETEAEELRGLFKDTLFKWKQLSLELSLLTFISFWHFSHMIMPFSWVLIVPS